MKNILILLLKFSLAGGLLYWLISSDKLDITQTKIILENKQFFAFLVLPILLLAMFLQNLRWWILLKLFGLIIPFKQAFLLTWIGNFFSVTLPGLVSGDVIKGVYFYRLKKPSLSKFDLISIYSTLFIDRIIGLLGLLIIFLFSIFILILEQKELASSLISLIILIATLVFFFFLFIFYPSKKKGKERWLEKIIQKLPKKEFFMKIYQNLMILRKHKWMFLLFIFISLVIHSLICFLFYKISTLLILKSGLAFWTQMSLVPLGLIVTAIPIFPAGLGIGHVAFENLYNLFGLKEGANIFNLFIIHQIFIYLLGVFPFLFYRRKRIAKNEK